MPFPARFSPPVAAAAAAAGAVLAAVALRRYLYSYRRRPSYASVTMSGQRTDSAAATLVVAGKSPEDQQLLASAASSLSLGDVQGGGEITIALASDAPVGDKDTGFNVSAYMDALQARRFGRWMLWSPRLASTQDLVAQ